MDGPADSSNNRQSAAGDAAVTSARSRWLAWWVIALMLIGLPAIGYSLLYVESDTTDMSQWLPEGRIERQRYDRFVEQFGPDDFVVVSWSQCQRNDARLDRFVRSLRTASEDEPDGAQLINRVISGPELLDRLTQQPIALSHRSAMRRLAGTMFGSDPPITCALIEVTPRGNLHPHAVIDQIRTSASSVGIGEDQLRLGGGIYEAVHIDEESLRSFRTYVGWSGVIAIGVAILSLRSIALTLIVVTAGGYCGGLSVALIFFSGMRFNALMLVLPMLVYVLVISSAVHLVNYYLDDVRERGTRGAAGRALAVGWLPCTLAAVTTAIGMMSLAASQIQHVRSFGIFSAVSLILSLVVLLAFVPASLSFLQWSKTNGHSRARRPLVSNSTIDRFGSFVVRKSTLVAGIMFAILVMIGFGLSFTTSSVKIERMFAPDDRLIDNYHWLEDNIGPLAAVETIVRIDDTSEMTMLKRLELLRELGKAIESVPDVGTVFSAATLTPPAPRRGLGGAARRAVLNKRLQSATPELIDDRLLAVESDAQYWRITARITALAEINHTALIESIDQQVQAVLEDDGLDSVGVTYTGTILVMNQARQQLLRDLVITFAAAFVLICPLMMLILRSVVAGLVSMIPNLVPAVVVFGSMGWLGIPIEIGTVLTACVALGIAVDDTLHFLTWYQRSRRLGKDRHESISVAYRRCAVAMIQTTMICGLGLLVFAASQFVPTSRFAVLMFALLTVALVGDLVMLPALLASPLGKFFDRRRLA
ncbi:MAG: MMPL family transporter [Pirellulaceae bacterium]|nr:MMPL family transporter [Pirellulaceae bacterium]